MGSGIYLYNKSCVCGRTKKKKKTEQRKARGGADVHGGRYEQKVEVNKSFRLRRIRRHSRGTYEKLQQWAKERGTSTSLVDLALTDLWWRTRLQVQGDSAATKSETPPHLVEVPRGHVARKVVRRGKKQDVQASKEMLRGRDSCQHQGRMGVGGMKAAV